MPFPFMLAVRPSVSEVVVNVRQLELVHPGWEAQAVVTADAISPISAAARDQLMPQMKVVYCSTCC